MQNPVQRPTTARPVLLRSITFTPEAVTAEAFPDPRQPANQCKTQPQRPCEDESLVYPHGYREYRCDRQSGFASIGEPAKLRAKGVMAGNLHIRRSQQSLRQRD